MARLTWSSHGSRSEVDGPPFLEDAGAGYFKGVLRFLGRLRDGGGDGLGLFRGRVLRVLARIPELLPDGGGELTVGARVEQAQRLFRPEGAHGLIEEGELGEMFETELVQRLGGTVPTPLSILFQ